MDGNMCTHNNMIALCVVALLMISVSIAGAQTTVYNNFGPDHEGWDYNYGLGWTVAGDSISQQYGVEQAMAFQSTADGTVTDIWVAFFYVPLNAMADTVTIRLTRNPTGQPPNTADIMEEWTITEFESWSQWSPPHHLQGNGTSQLQAGENYWLWAIGTETTWTGWCVNIYPGVTCPHTLRREGENWLPIAYETASAFRVDVGIPWQIHANNFRNPNQLDITWRSQPGALYYNIYTSPNPSGTFELVTTTSDTTWTTIIEDQRGFYRVTAELE